MTWTKTVLKAGVVVLVPTAGLLTHIAPASAHGTGETKKGSSNIDKLATPASPLCLSPELNTKITLPENTGSFNDAAGRTFKAEWTQVANLTYYFGPNGTYSDNMCTIPYAVPGTLAISAGPGGGAESCVDVAATYQRGDGTAANAGKYTITTGATTTSCKIGTVVHPHGSTWSFTGTQLACSEQVECDPPGPIGPVEFTGNYVQG